MTRDRFIAMGALVLALVSIGAASTLQEPILEQRTELRLTADPDVLASLPPEIAFTQVALGSFRGLMVDYLWARATNLQQQAKYHEAVQLAEWITRLQPRFSRVWAFHAWNLAYNIAITSPRPEERWQWVQAGIRLLRDQGLELNPTKNSLHRELAWLFQHKIASDTDDTHYYYKDQLAREWQDLLGAPPSEGRVAWFLPVAEAPRSEAELESLWPQAAKVWRAASEQGLTSRELLITLGPEAETGAEPLGWDSLEPAERDGLLAYLRARVLREIYRMDPQLMGDLMRECGPMDWRHPATHSLYWITQGILRDQYQRRAVRFPTVESQPWDEAAVEARRRFYAHVNVGIAAKMLVLTGQISEDLEQGFYLRVPQPEMIPFLQSTLRGYGDRSEAQSGDPSGDFSVILERSLIEALFTSFFYDGPEAAELYRSKLAQSFSRGPERTERYALPLEELLRELLWLDVVDAGEELDSVIYEVQELLLRSLGDGLAVGRLQVASRCRDLAADFLAWAVRRLEEGSLPGSLEVPPFEQLQRDTLAGFLRLPSRYASPQKKSRVWQVLNPEYRQALSRDVLVFLRAQATRAGLEPESAFPE